MASAAEFMRSPAGAGIPVIVNTSAGVGALPGAFLEGLAAHGFAPVVVAVPARGVADAVRSAVRSGARILAVSGGDGTLSTAAAELLGRETALLPLPAGTRNHFARRVGIHSVDDAVRALVAGDIVTLAAGEVAGRAFLNNASCGLYAHFVRARGRLARWLGKWPAAALAAALVLARLPLMEVILEAGGRRVRRRTAVVWIGVGRGSFRIPEDRSALRESARELEIVVARAASRLGLLWVCARALIRQLRGRWPALERGLEVLHARSLTLESAQRIDVALDGEAFRWGAPLQFAVREHALRVLVPPQPAE